MDRISDNKIDDQSMLNQMNRQGLLDVEYSQMFEKYEIPEEWLPSAGACKVVSILKDDIDRPDGEAVEHAVRSLKTLATFCKNVEPKRRQAMADAMLLHDVLGRTLHEETEERWLLSSYLQDDLKEYVKSPEGRTAFTYMHDQVTIGAYAREYRESMKEGLLNDPDYDGMLNVDAWKVDVPAIDGDGLQALSKKVNIESLIIKAAEMLDNVKYPPKQDSQQLRNILEVESVYSPMLEALGYDAMAAEMASTCHIYRLYGQGQGDIVEKAAQTYQEYSREDPADIIQQALALEEKPEVKWIVNQTSDDIKSGINCRFAELEVDFHGMKRRFLFRQKSIGSMAKKLYRKGDDYNLLDVFGLQMIVDAGDQTLNKMHHYEMSNEQIDRIHGVQVEDLTDCFSEFAKVVLTNPKLDLCSTNGYRKPIFVQGDEDFIAKVFSGLPSDMVSEIGQEEDRRKSVPYRVAKMTTKLDGKPVEVQMITDLDRKLGRTGETSHIAYKNGGGNDGIRWIQYLHKRMEYMKTGEGNPISREMGELAVRAVMRGIYSITFAPKDLHEVRISG